MIAGTSALKPSHAPPPSSSVQPGKPPAENHCSFTANSRMSRIANQKFGIAMPIWLAASVIVINFIVDVLYVVIDPRLKVSGG